MTNNPVLQDILVPRNPGCLNAVRVENESCCTVKYDRILRFPVLVMKGDLSHARVQIPREECPPSSLQLPHSLIVLQTYLSSFDSFALEVIMSISTFLRVKLIIGTLFTKATVEDPSGGLILSKMPLIIPRNRWVQVVFHVSGIVSHLLDLPPIKTIDAIILTGTCKTSRLMTSNDEDEAINATPLDMVLFAVPAYAPPIWRTAAPTIQSLNLLNMNKTSIGNSNNAVESPVMRLPVVGETPVEKRRSPAMAQQENSSKLNLQQQQQQQQPLRLERHSPRMESLQTNQPSFLSENNQESRAATILRGFADVAQSRQEQQQQQQQQQLNETRPISSAGSSSYIRLVNHTNIPSHRNSNAIMRLRSNNLALKEPVNNPTVNSSSTATTTIVSSSSTTAATSSSAIAATAVADTLCSITGWEESVDLLTAVSAAPTNNTEYTGKSVSSLSQAASGDRSGGGGGGGGNNKSNNSAEPLSPKTQRLKKVMELRKRPVIMTNRRRRIGGSDSQVGGDSDSGGTAAKRKGITARRLHMRKRIKLLKEAQVSARRIQEMKKLPASELPIDPHEEALMMVGEETVDVMNEPRCGYGFGYLGVLREGGGFETDEGADIKLKGALTLELSELSEDEEEEEGSDDNADEDGDD